MTIKQNKAQTILFSVIVFIAVVAFLYFTIYDVRKFPHRYTLVLDNVIIYWLFRALCLVCALISSYAGAWFVNQIFSDKPLIVICDEYFYDNSSALSLGKIAWSDIDRAYIKGGYLNIDLVNPDEYFAKMGRGKRILINANLKLGYGDVCITSIRFRKHRKKFLEEFGKRVEIEQ